MKLMKILLALVFAVVTAFASTPGAQEEEHAGWMKTAQATAGKLRTNIGNKAAEDVAKDAAAMEEVFKKCEEFWKKRNTEDAVKWSQQSQTSAKEIADAAKSGDMEKASTSLRSLMGNCSACHTAHREKLAEGGYKIK